tara:strand:- start:42 stop:695 length:654 start_codon:yes stop_codon:yes gene_type:complete
MTAPKPFNLKSAKKGTGYEVPEGHIFSWNDFAVFFTDHVQYSMVVGESKKKLEATQTSIETLKYGAHYSTQDTRKTALGEFFFKFQDELKVAIFDGRIGLFQRPRSVQQDVDLPEGLRSLSSKGYLLSSTEVFALMEKVKNREYLKGNRMISTGHKQFLKLLHQALSEMPNYEKADVVVANDALAKDKILDVSPKPEHPKTKSRLTGGSFGGGIALI